MQDDACPTCGSKKFYNVEVKKNSDDSIIYEKKCNKCKKFWFTSK